MRSNGHSEAPGSGVLRTADALSHVRWQTDEALALPLGAVRASGDASPQVRSPQRLAAVGDVTAQIAHIQRAIVEALTGALEGMEPAADDLHSRRDEIASLTLVAANRRLGAVGVALLDLRIGEMALSP
jgi:hypothetical protein